MEADVGCPDAEESVFESPLDGPSGPELVSAESTPLVGLVSGPEVVASEVVLSVPDVSIAVEVASASASVDSG